MRLSSIDPAMWNYRFYYAGKTFVIRTDRRDGARFIEGMELNDKIHTGYPLDHRDIADGGVLEFSLAERF